MADPWENIPPEVACQIFGNFHDIADIITAIQVSKTFRNHGRQCIRRLSNPSPMGFPLFLIDGFNYLQRMMNTFAIVSSVEEAGIIRPMYLLKEANFVIKIPPPPATVEPIAREILRSYLTPVNVAGLEGPQIHQRTLNDSIIRIAVIDNDDKIQTLTVFDHGGTFNVVIHPPEMMLLSSEIHLTHGVGEFRPLRSIVKHDVLECFREADLGPVDPRSPPGPNNPLLKERLVFFRAGEVSTRIILGYLFLLYAKRHRLFEIDKFNRDPIVGKWLGRYPRDGFHHYVFFIETIISMLINVTTVDFNDMVTVRAIPSSEQELEDDYNIVGNAVGLTQT